MCAADQFQQYPGSATLDRGCTWARQIGTASTDSITGTAVDSSGNAIVVGYTLGALPSFPSLGQADGFVRKYDPAGAILWTDRFGGAGYDTPNAVTVDASGNIFIAGTTGSAFPGQTLAGYNNAFVRKYNAAGTAQFTKQFGNTSPSGSAYGQAIALDAAGNIIIGGSTNAAFPTFTQGAVYDGLLLKLDAAGVLVWVTQIGGVGNDPVYINAVAADVSGNIFVTGSTSIALPGQTLSAPGNPDAFVRKYTPAGAVSATTQFGNVALQPLFGYGIALDAAGNVYIAGTTYAAFPGYSHFGVDGFVRKYDSSLTSVWLRELSEPNVGASGNAIAVDGSGNSYFAGTTPGVLTGQTSSGGADVFVRSFDTAGTERWTHQLGSAGAETVNAVAVDASGQVFVGGSTTGTWVTQPANAGGSDAFVLRVLR